MLSLCHNFEDLNSYLKGIFPTVTVGYRYQNKYGGTVFKIAFTPYFKISSGSYGSDTGTEFMPFGGLSIGYAF